MTDNEKAATFIGWRQGEWCPDHHLCPTAYEDDHTARHLLRAPDMTDPRNYMKALEGLTGWTWELTFCPDFMPKESFEMVMNQRDKKRRRDDDGNDILTYSPTAGGTVVKALAALYDAEHAQSNAR